MFLPLFPAWLKTQSYSEESIGLLLACGYIFRFSGSILPYYEGSVTMWFKNLISYRLTKHLDWDLNELQRQLSDCEFHPCGSQDQSKFGWTNPLKDSELLYFFRG